VGFEFSYFRGKIFKFLEEYPLKNNEKSLENRPDSKKESSWHPTIFRVSLFVSGKIISPMVQSVLRKTHELKNAALEVLAHGVAMVDMMTHPKEKALTKSLAGVFLKHAFLIFTPKRKCSHFCLSKLVFVTTLCNTGFCK